MNSFKRKQNRRRKNVARERHVAGSGVSAVKRLLHGGRIVINNLRVLLHLAKLARVNSSREEKPAEPDSLPGFHPSLSREQAEALLADLQADNK